MAKNDFKQVRDRAGQCLTVTGAETVTLSADGDALFAYAGTTRL